LARSAIGQHTVVHPVFIITMNETCFRGNRRRYRTFLQCGVDAESADSCGYFDGYSSENEDWNDALIKNPRLV
jgi:histidyl-tRNA synthetase